MHFSLFSKQVKIKQIISFVINVIKIRQEITALQDIRFNKSLVNSLASYPRNKGDRYFSRSDTGASLFLRAANLRGKETTYANALATERIDICFPVNRPTRDR